MMSAPGLQEQAAEHTPSSLDPQNASNDFGLDDFAQQNSFIFGDLLADSYDFAQLDSSNFVTQDASGPVGESILLGDPPSLQQDILEMLRMEGGSDSTLENYPWSDPTFHLTDLNYSLAKTHNRDATSLLDMNDPNLNMLDDIAVNKVRTFASNVAGSTHKIIAEEGVCPANASTIDPSILTLPYGIHLGNDKSLKVQPPVLHPSSSGSTSKKRTRAAAAVDNPNTPEPKRQRDDPFRSSLSSCLHDNYGKKSTSPYDASHAVVDGSTYVANDYRILEEFNAICAKELEVLSLALSTTGGADIPPLTMYFQHGARINSVTLDRGSILPIPPAPSRSSLFWNMPFVRRQELPSLLASAQWNDPVIVAKRNGRGQICCGLFQSRRLQEYLVRRNFLLACFEVFPYFASQPPEVIPLIKLSRPHELPPAPDMCESKIRDIQKWDTEHSRKMKGPVAAFQEEILPASNLEFRFTSKEILTQSTSDCPPEQHYIYAGFKEGPPAALVTHLMEARNDDHKDMLLMSRRLFHDNFQPHKSSNGKLLYRYGTREELRDALEQHTFDRLKPAVEFLAQATGKPSEKANSQPLPFCGIPLLDNVVSIALTGKYNLRYCIINRRYLEEEIPAMKHAPKISVHTWASCSVTAEECAWIELGIQKHITYFFGRYQGYVELFIDMLKTRLHEYLSLEHALLSYTSQMGRLGIPGASVDFNA